MLDCGVCLLDWYRIWRRLSPPLTHACIAQSPHENERLGFLNSSAPQLQLSRVRSSTSLGLAQDVDVQLSTSQYSITHPACCQPAMGTWAAVEVIFNSPPAGGRRGVRRFVALHESLHGSPTRTDFSFNTKSYSTVFPFPFQIRATGQLHCMLHVSSAGSACLPATYVKGHLPVPAPTPSFGRRGCCISHPVHQPNWDSS
jgi:hypothetical protein